MSKLSLTHGYFSHFNKKLDLFCYKQTNGVFVGENIKPQQSDVIIPVFDHPRRKAPSCSNSVQEIAQFLYANYEPGKEKRGRTEVKKTYHLMKKELF